MPKRKRDDGDEGPAKRPSTPTNNPLCPCGRIAWYGPKNSRLRLRCYACRDATDAHATNPVCVEGGCMVSASFGLPGSGRAGRRHCIEHKTDDEVDVKHRTCEEPGCSTLPSYGQPGSGNAGARHCKAHMTNGEVNVVSRTCEEPGCSTLPSFGLPGSGKAGARHCAAHKTDDEVDVKNRTCEEPGCSTKPSYGQPGSGKAGARHCKAHMTDGEVDVVTRTCEEPGCSTQPSYGPPGSGKAGARHCKDHMTDGEVDVKHRTCEEPGCSTRAFCGLVGQAATLCGPHADSVCGSVAYPRRLCAVPRCRSLGTHALLCDASRLGGLRSKAASSRRWCDAHADQAPGPTVDFVSRPCGACALPDVLLPNGLCATCQPDPQTGRPPTRRLLLQRQVESAIRARLDPPLLALLESVDTVPDQLRGCTRRRPDLLFQCGTHAVVLEVDEEQHRCAASGGGSHTPECEQARMAEVTELLWQATGCADGYGVHWLRFNPSAYRPAGQGIRAELPEQRIALLLRVLRRALRAETAYVRAVGARGGAEDPRPAAAVTELFFDGWEAWHAGVATDLATGGRTTVDLPDGGDPPSVYDDSEQSLDEATSDDD